MRWQQLFADLQAQFEAEESAAEQAEAGSRARAEIGALALVDRLRGAAGSPARPALRGARARSPGTLVDVGRRLAAPRGRRAAGEGLVARRRAGGRGPGTATAPPEAVGPVRGRLDLRRALRGLARDRSAVQVVLDDGGVLTGTLDRVGPTTWSSPSTRPTCRGGRRRCRGCGRSSSARGRRPDGGGRAGLSGSVRRGLSASAAGSAAAVGRRAPRRARCRRGPRRTSAG